LDDGIVMGPDRSFVVARRIVGAHVGCQGPGPQPNLPEIRRRAGTDAGVP
jgi:hypothetical protein